MTPQQLIDERCALFEQAAINRRKELNRKLSIIQTKLDQHKGMIQHLIRTKQQKRPCEAQYNQ